MLNLATMQDVRAVSRHLPLLSLAAAACVLILVSGASAHGILQYSSPTAGTVLPSAPDRLELRFNESIDPQLSAVVLVRENRRIPLALRAANGPRLSYTLPPLEPGLYMVDWRVISTVDGHLARGAFAFGVGEVTLPAGTVEAAGPAWFEVAVRWTGLVGVLVLVGGAVMFMALPAPEAAVPALRVRLHRLAIVAAAAITVAGLFRVFIDAAAITGGTSLLGASGWSLLRVLAASHSGHDLVFRATGAIFMVSLLRPALPLERGGAGTVLGVLLIGPTLTSHGLSVGLGGVAIGLAHLIAASIWIGGLAFFGTAYLPVVRAAAPDIVWPAALRFSRLALVSLGVLMLTGFLQGWLFVGSPAALTGSFYGQTLLVKLIVVAPLLALAAMNRWGVLPRTATAGSSWRSLLILVRLETALGLVVALLAAAIAISQPVITGR